MINPYSLVSVTVAQRPHKPQDMRCNSLTSDHSLSNLIWTSERSLEVITLPLRFNSLESRQDMLGEVKTLSLTLPSLAPLSNPIQPHTGIGLIQDDESKPLITSFFPRGEELVISIITNVESPLRLYFNALGDF